MTLNLRPGNYVYLLDPSDTSHKKVNLAKISGVDKDFAWIVHYTSSLFEEPIKVLRNDLESVEIDTNWLDDFEFQEINPLHYFTSGIRCDILFIINQNEQTQIIFAVEDEDQTIEICKIMSVSHLQNLVYDTTGSMPALSTK